MVEAPALNAQFNAKTALY